MRHRPRRNPVKTASNGWCKSFIKQSEAGYGTVEDYNRHTAAPLGVFMQVGIGKHFWINLILTLLGYLPGIIHAIWVIAKKK